MSVYAVRDALVDSKLTIALTGAGISVESGIPDFRSSGGLWQRFPPEVFGTIDAFRDDPERFWSFWLELVRVCSRATPNAGHRALAELESLGRLRHVITQNVDGLHTAGGTKALIELHGTPDALVCLECRARRPEKTASLTAPPRCECGSIMKPDVVLFGEMLPPGAIERAQELASSCDVCLVIGTSAQVYPTASIPEMAFDNGATIVELNVEPTGLTHTGKVRHFIKGKAGTTLPRILELVRESSSS